MAAGAGSARAQGLEMEPRLASFKSAQFQVHPVSSPPRRADTTPISVPIAAAARAPPASRPLAA